MKASLLTLHNTLLSFGVDGLKALRQLRGMPSFVQEWVTFRTLLRQNPRGWNMGRLWPIMTDRAESAGVTKGHYFHMDLFMAQQVAQAAPPRHLDIGSRIDGFVAHLATTMPVLVGDIRPVASQHENIKFVQLNLMDPSTAAKLGQFPSVSCLHTIEHMGLGRYGDPLDPAGDSKALATLAALTMPGGTLYLATPMGRERIEFNAQRVYSIARLQNMLAEEGFTITQFAYVDDQGDLIPQQELSPAFHESSNTFHFSCALIVARKCGGAKARASTVKK
jgi:hypothetical protein